MRKSLFRLIMIPGIATLVLSGVFKNVQDRPLAEERLNPAALPELSAPRVGIYTGSGYSEESVEAIKNFLDAYNIRWAEFDQSTVDNRRLNELFDALWFAGGFSEEYRYYLDGHDQVRSFVKNGGVFIGTCAGAFYAANQMIWHDPNLDDPLHLDYPLNLFKGAAIGPIFSLQQTITLNEKHPVNAGFPPALEMHYLSGPYFIPHDRQEIDILAEYAGDQAAVISFSYGAGKVLLMGPHPELGYADGTYNTRGGDGAQWQWLYTAVKWILD